MGTPPADDGIHNKLAAHRSQAALARVAKGASESSGSGDHPGLQVIEHTRGKSTRSRSQETRHTHAACTCTAEENTSFLLGNFRSAASLSCRVPLWVGGQRRSGKKRCECFELDTKTCTREEAARAHANYLLSVKCPTLMSASSMMSILELPTVSLLSWFLSSAHRTHLLSVASQTKQERACRWCGICSHFKSSHAAV